MHCGVEVTESSTNKQHHPPLLLARCIKEAKGLSCELTHSVCHFAGRVDLQCLSPFRRCKTELPSFGEVVARVHRKQTK
jgi:hypothetical protein